MKTMTSVTELVNEGFPYTLISAVLHSQANRYGEIAFRDNNAPNAKYRIWREKFIREVERRCRCGKW